MRVGQLAVVTSVARPGERAGDYARIVPDDEAAGRGRLRLGG
jgi:hypothetical protein